MDVTSEELDESNVTNTKLDESSDKDNAASEEF